MNWGDFKVNLRRTYLKDDGVVDPDTLVVTYEYSNERIYDALRVAQNLLVPHTALEKTAEYESPDYDMGTAVLFPVPDDAAFLLDKTGLIYYVETDGTQVYVIPVDRSRPTNPSLSDDTIGFTQWPATSIKLTAPIGSGNKLCVDYYAYYEMPDDADDDTFVLTYPRWAEAAVCLMTAYYCLIGQSVIEANIGQYKAGQDKGQPENSSLRQQLDFLKKKFNEELATRNPQQRLTY